jgi:GMP synthase (glutamine-hydrolysing)
MTAVIILQHAACEAPGTILDALTRANIAFEVVQSGAGQAVPRDLAAAAGVIVMGGPMSVYESETHPYLRDELRLLELALAQRAPLLGICLGSQLLAVALGARVYASGYKELGWHGVQLKSPASADPLFAELPRDFTALHWHGDIFDLPDKASSLASSKRTEHQAFVYDDHAYGLLFHLEATAAQVAAMAGEFPHELEQANVRATELLQETARFADLLQPLAATVFGGFAKLVRARS